MSAHATPRTVSFFTESTFAVPPDDASAWNSSGVETFVLEPDTSGVKQEMLPNENYRQGMLRGHPHVLALKAPEASFGQYLTGTGTSATGGAQAAGTQLTENLKCSMGNVKRGYACGLTSNSSAVLTVDSGHGANMTAGDFLFCRDLSAGTGYFYRVLSVSTDDLTMDRDIEFTVASNDIGNAVIAAYFDEDSLTNHSDANHITRSIFFKGADSSDNVEVSGCKMAAEITGLASGETPRVNFSVTGTDFKHEDAPTPSLADAPQGIPPLVVGADTARIYLAPFGDPLTELGCTFGLEPTVGITWTKVPGLNGTEGVCGYVADGFDDIGVKLTIPYVNTYNTGFRALSEYHLLLQIGDQAGTAIMLYFPRLQISEDPMRGDHTGLTSIEIMFKALYNSEARALTGDDLELWRSPMVVGVVA